MIEHLTAHWGFHTALSRGIYAWDVAKMVLRNTAAFRSAIFLINPSIPATSILVNSGEVKIFRKISNDRTCCGLWLMEFQNTDIEEIKPSNLFVVLQTDYCISGRLVCQLNRAGLSEPGLSESVGDKFICKKIRYARSPGERQLSQCAACVWWLLVPQMYASDTVHVNPS